MTTNQAAVRERLKDVVREHGGEIAEQWARLQVEQAVLEGDISETELREEAVELVEALGDGLSSPLSVNRVVKEHTGLRDAVTRLSLRRARIGSTPTATSLAVMALKEVLLERVRDSVGDAGELLAAALLLNRLLDSAGALTFETYVAGREEIIQRQNRQLLEMSTPVVKLWRQVLAVPLIGTLDSARTQVVMENLLQAIQDHEALISIIDITGVPTVDTVVAQHLMHTVNAVRMMGADCVISGIRPPIAQTIAQLGIDLSAILTRATLADALAAAIGLTGQETQAGPREGAL